MSFTDIQNKTMNIAVEPIVAFVSAVVELIMKGIRKFVKARQDRANMEIARILQRNEYRNEDVWTIKEAIDKGELRSLDRV